MEACQLRPRQFPHPRDPGKSAGVTMMANPTSRMSEASPALKLAARRTKNVIERTEAFGPANISLTNSSQRSLKGSKV